MSLEDRLDAVELGFDAAAARTDDPVETPTR